MALDWSAQFLRVSLFSSADVALSEKDWQVITGQDEASTRQNIPGGKVFAGQFLGGQFNLSFSPKRVDAVLTQMDKLEAPTAPELPIIGKWEQVKTEFADATSAWLKGTTFPIVRIAFAAIVLCEVRAPDDAYGILKEQIKSVAVKPGRMRDFSYRINWRVKSKVKTGLLINRLTTWTPIKFAIKSLQFTGEQVAVGGGAEEVHAARLEMDINTDQANTNPIAPSEAVHIYSELIELAAENAAKGEVIES